MTHRSAGHGPPQGERLLEHRFADHLLHYTPVEAGDRLFVALSGGVDSVTLLHLLRFGPSLPNSGLPEFDLHAAHFDHRMREGSAADREWIVGLCRAWDVPLASAAAEEVPGSEEEAREMRYAFLERVVSPGPGWVLTAHHRDDQIETVLFRALRGTGLPGLAGIPSVRRPHLVRPLLPFSKEALRSYSGRFGVSVREDPTNRIDDFARNRLRNTLLPWIRREISPAVDSAMLRLARAAERNERAWTSVLERVTEELAFSRTDRSLAFTRDDLQAYDSAALEQMAYFWSRMLGVVLRERGCETLVEFIRRGTSGTEVEVGDGFRARYEFDRLILFREEKLDVRAMERPSAPDELRVPSARPGRGGVRIGGREFDAVWGLPGPPVADWKESFDADELAFPLFLRGWHFGDRIHMPYGTKKVKKLFGERRVRSSERERVCVLVDAEGRLLWIPGLVRSTLARPSPDRPVFRIGVSAERST